jgi:hypothetical protein
VRLTLSEKFSYYDVVAHLIPGTLFCLFIFYTFYLLAIVPPKPDVGSLGTLGIGVAVAYTAGHLLQAIASTLEPFYYAVWGGKPSVRLLERDSDLFSDAQRLSLIDALLSYFDVKEECPKTRPAAQGFYQRLFERCMAVCNRNCLGRVDSFNAAYGFHRVLLTTFVCAFLSYSVIWALQLLGLLALSTDKRSLLWVLIASTAAGTWIELFRARKRAYYYAREVLWMTADFIRGSGQKR